MRMGWYAENVHEKGECSFLHQCIYFMYALNANLTVLFALELIFKYSAVVHCHGKSVWADSKRVSLREQLMKLLIKAVVAASIRSCPSFVWARCRETWLMNPLHWYWIKVPWGTHIVENIWLSWMSYFIWFRWLSSTVLISSRWLQKRAGLSWRRAGIAPHSVANNWGAWLCWAAPWCEGLSMEKKMLLLNKEPWSQLNFSSVKEEL